MRRTSADGTPIAFTRAGHGPPLILIDGALCHRGAGPNRGLAKRLAQDFTVLTYDRRGRGESGDTAPYAVEREVEDIAAVVETVGAPVHLYGISSGGMLALEAAARLASDVAKLVLYEIPFVVDESRPPVGAEVAARLDALVAAGRRGAAVKLFMREVRYVLPARNSVTAGARASGLTWWVWPASVACRALGRTLASCAAPLRTHAGLRPPHSTSAGTSTKAHRRAGRGSPRWVSAMTARS